jgi:hypothetical protein
VLIYVSHSAPLSEQSAKRLGQPVEWFIVEPRRDPMDQVERLRKAGRTVVGLEIEPSFESKVELDA